MLKIEYKALICANKRTLHRYTGRLSMNTVDAVQMMTPRPPPDGPEDTVYVLYVRHRRQTQNGGQT